MQEIGTMGALGRPVERVLCDVGEQQSTQESGWTQLSENSTLVLLLQLLQSLGGCWNVWLSQSARLITCQSCRLVKKRQLSQQQH